MIAYESEVKGGESHIALVRGDLCPDCPALHLGPAGHPRCANEGVNGAASTPVPPRAPPARIPSSSASTPAAPLAMSSPPTAIAARSSTNPCA